MGEQNWVYYELGGGLERRGCHTKSEVKTSLATQRKRIFFLIRRRKLETRWLSSVPSIGTNIAYVVVVEWGSQNCVLGLVQVIAP